MHLEVITRESNTRPTRAPLLFVHGSCHAAWCWEEHFLDFFAGHGFNSYAVSLRGHGQSDGHERLRWTSILDYVEDIQQVAATLPRKPVLVGHSLGGFVVQKYLEKHRAAGAVLLTPHPVRGMLRFGMRLVQQYPLLFVKLYLTLNPGVLYSTPARARTLLFSANASEEEVVSCVRRLGPESFRAFLDVTFSPPRVEAIRSGQTPMLVLGAAEDALVTPDEIENTARAYDASSRIFSRLGHDMMLEAGWEQVATHVVEWLETQKL